MKKRLTDYKRFDEYLHRFSKECISEIIDYRFSPLDNKEWEKKREQAEETLFSELRKLIENDSVSFDDTQAHHLLVDIALSCVTEKFIVPEQIDAWSQVFADIVGQGSREPQEVFKRVQHACAVLYREDRESERYARRYL